MRFFDIVILKMTVAEVTDKGIFFPLTAPIGESPPLARSRQYGR